MADLAREEWPQARGNQSLKARLRAGPPAAPAQIARTGKRRSLEANARHQATPKIATARPAPVVVHVAMLQGEGAGDR